MGTSSTMRPGRAEKTYTRSDRVASSVVGHEDDGLAEAVPPSSQRRVVRRVRSGRQRARPAARSLAGEGAERGPLHPRKGGGVVVLKAVEAKGHERHRLLARRASRAMASGSRTLSAPAPRRGRWAYPVPDALVATRRGSLSVRAHQPTDDVQRCSNRWGDERANSSRPTDSRCRPHRHDARAPLPRVGGEASGAPRDRSMTRNAGRGATRWGALASFKVTLGNDRLR